MPLVTVGLGRQPKSVKCSPHLEVANRPCDVRRFLIICCFFNAQKRTYTYRYKQGAFHSVSYHGWLQTVPHHLVKPLQGAIEIVLKMQT